MPRPLLRFAILGSALAASLLALAVVVFARPSTAAAHPLGNFTVNRYSRIELYSNAIRIRYVLDMAEIPTFQEMERIDADGDGEVSDAERDAYATGKAGELLDGLRLTVNGSRAELRPLSRELSFPPGQGGLNTLRLALVLETPVSASELFGEYRDDNYADRIGWKEIIVRPTDGVTLFNSTVPPEDITDELRTYPADLLSSPLDVRQAGFRFHPDAGAAAPPVRATAPAPVVSAPERPGGAFVSLISTRDLTLPVLLLSLLAALGFGALHALEPGHGKTFVAAYFVGVRGTVRHALLLGLTVAVTHTIGVLAIGLVTLYGSKFVLPERLYPWLTLASALLVFGLGLRLLAVRLLGGARHHHHGPGGHDHPESERDPATPPWKSLVALGLADGLLPSPSTLIVLLAAISLDRIGLGLLLIVAFSVGLAAALASVSLALVCTRRLAEWLGARRWPAWGQRYASLLAGGGVGARVLSLGPAVGSLALVAVGLVLMIRALSQPAILGI